MTGRVAALGAAAAALVLGVVLAASSGPSARPGAVAAPPAVAPAASTPPGGAPAPTGPLIGPGGCSVAAPPPGPGGATFVVCYRLSGQVTAEGGFVDRGQGAGALSCAAWAARGDQPAGTEGSVLLLPDPGDAGITVNGQPLGFFLEIGNYAGPGVYGPSPVAESVTYGTAESWSTNADTAATLSAQVSPDGSGTVTAGGLRNDASTGGTETVTERWTCSAAAGA